MAEQMQRVAAKSHGRWKKRTREGGEVGGNMNNSFLSGIMQVRAQLQLCTATPLYLHRRLVSWLRLFCFNYLGDGVGGLVGGAVGSPR